MAWERKCVSLTSRGKAAGHARDQLKGRTAHSSKITDTAEEVSLGLLRNVAKGGDVFHRPVKCPCRHVSVHAHQSISADHCRKNEYVVSKGCRVRLCM